MVAASTSASAVPVELRLDVGAVLDVLPEVADVAADLLIGLDAEWDDRDEAEGEPFPPLHGAGGEVAAVLALEGEVVATGKS